MHFITKMWAKGLIQVSKAVKVSKDNTIIVIAELREAPWVRKIGNPSSRENLVMTSAYERLTNAVRTDSGGGGRSSRGEPHGGGTGDLRNAIFSRRDLSEKILNCICYVDKRSGTLI